MADRANPDGVVARSRQIWKTMSERIRLRPAPLRPWTWAEAAVGCAAIAGVTTSLLVAPGLRGAIGAALALLMLAIAAIDARRFIIPDELSAAAFALALVHAALCAPDAVLEAAAIAVLRGGLVALVFMAVRVGYRALREREGIGLGDVKLAGVAGAWLDWSTLPIAVEIAAVAALAIHLVRQHVLRRPVRPTNRLPFGLFLAPAIWLGWLWEALLLAPY